VLTLADAEHEEDYYRGAVEVPPLEGETDAAPILADDQRWYDDGGRGDPDRPSGLA
jgi:hypothetical protein